jgi:hypothetical protein
LAAAVDPPVGFYLPKAWIPYWIFLLFLGIFFFVSFSFLEFFITTTVLQCEAIRKWWRLPALSYSSTWRPSKI